MTAESALAGHLRTFFEAHLIGQRRLSPNTVLAYRDALKRLLLFASDALGKPVADVSFDDLDVALILHFLDHLERDRANGVATRNLRLVALRTFYRHVAARDPRSFALCQRVLAIPVKRAPKPSIDYLERDEMEALLRAADRSTPDGRRDYALMSFAWQTGAPSGEITALRACDLQLEAPAHVRIWGKGRKERAVPLWARTATVLRAWLVECDPRGAAPVFVNVHGQPLTRWGVRYILRKHARSAAETCPGLAGKRVHPHALRHTTAVHMLQAGADPSAIRDVLGHASAETTWRYTHVSLEMKRRIVESYGPGGTGDASPVAQWRRDPDLLAELEAIGRRRAYVAPESGRKREVAVDSP